MIVSAAWQDGGARESGLGTSSHGAAEAAGADRRYK